jgi:hypothetical protein
MSRFLLIYNNYFIYSLKQNGDIRGYCFNGKRKNLSGKITFIRRHSVTAQLNYSMNNQYINSGQLLQMMPAIIRFHQHGAIKVSSVTLSVSVLAACYNLFTKTRSNQSPERSVSYEKILQSSH